MDIEEKLFGEYHFGIEGAIDGGMLRYRNFLGMDENSFDELLLKVTLLIRNEDITAHYLTRRKTGCELSISSNG